MLSVLCQRSPGRAKRELNSRANPFRPISTYRREADPVEVGATGPVGWVDKGLLSSTISWVPFTWGKFISQKEGRSWLARFREGCLFHLWGQPEARASSGQIKTWGGVGGQNKRIKVTPPDLTGKKGNISPKVRKIWFIPPWWAFRCFYLTRAMSDDFWHL